MKIAITGDVHLTRKSEHPERYNAIENIMDQLIANNIDNLIIAGDLFDADTNNYSEFESFCSAEKFKDLKIIIIPGNHDHRLEQKYFTYSNITILDKPEIIKFGSSNLQVMFLPYQLNETMGEGIARNISKIEDENWILISHGDYMDGVRVPNPYEPGIYMPLTRKDVEQFKPSKVILGHIHKSMDSPVVYYTGSPCPLHIKETGYRSYLLLDTEELSVERHEIKSNIIYFDDVCIVIPRDDEEKYIEELVESIIENWDLNPDDINRVVMRLKVRGYINNKLELKAVLDRKLSAIKYYNDEEIDLSEVSVPTDLERIDIVNKVMDHIDSLEWEDSQLDPSKEDIKISALKTIFEV